MNEQALADPAAMATTPTSIWKPWFHGLLALATIALALAVRLLQLDSIPGEFYGDIAIVREYVDEIWRGAWPTYFDLSAGPLYHYAIAPILAVTGTDYQGIKLASVLVGLLTLMPLYGLGRQLHSIELGLLSAFVGAVGSWLLIFSRLGNSQIIIPLLAVSAILLVVRVAKYGRLSDVIGSAAVSALGLYAYPQTFILAPVMLATLTCLWLTGTAVRPRHLLVFVLSVIPLAIPFGLIIAPNFDGFLGGYIGGKLETTANPFATLAINFYHAMTAFNIRGDEVFRSNPASLPHLDAISGVFWLLGAVFWVGRRRWRLSPAIFVPFVLLQVPSMLVLSAPDEVPSASRTIAVAPLAYVLVASGLWWVAATMYRGIARWPRVASSSTAALAILVLAALATLNIDRYWGDYVAGLPDDNTPFGRTIAEYIDALPDDMTVVVVGCCWGAWGQPEPKGIKYSLRRSHDVRFIATDKVTCAALREVPSPAVVVWRPRETLPAPQLSDCASLLAGELHVRNEKEVFYVSALDAS